MTIEQLEALIERLEWDEADAGDDEPGSVDYRDIIAAIAAIKELIELRKQKVEP